MTQNIHNNLVKVESNPQSYSECFEKIFDLLVRHKAIDKTIATLRSSQQKKQTPLHYVVMFSDKRHVETVGILNIVKL